MAGAALTASHWPVDSLAIAGRAALAGLAVTLVAGGRGFWTRPALALGAVALAALALSPATFVVRAFGRIDLTPMLFHLRYGFDWRMVQGLTSELMAAALVPVLLVLAAHGLSRALPLRSAGLLALAAGLLLVNPLIRFVPVWAASAASSDLGDWLARPVLTDGAPDDPDLVVIYLEGADRQFADTAIWGAAYAPLARLAGEGLSLTAVGQIEGTDWSVAGMVASQCGVPALARGFLWRANLQEVDRFMPAMTCLGDVLAHRGYRSAFVVGADMSFGALDTFYLSHGIADLTGLDRIERDRPEEARAARIIWLVDDELTLDVAHGKAVAMWQGDRPAALIVETAGPHGRDSTLTRTCSGTGRAERGPVGQAVRCLADHVEATVAALRADHARMRPGRRLAFVILSDHLNHQPDTPLPAEGLRKVNTAILIGGARGEIDRQAAMIDIFPTLLDWLGWAEPPVAAGLGRSLLSPGPTLVEDRGIAALDLQLTRDVDVATRVWAEP